MTVFVSVSMSLDGFIAPEGMDLDHAEDPGYKNWAAKWSELQKWAFGQKFFRENLGLGEGGETGPDNQLAEHTFERTGVSIMGKRMFDAGERMWPAEAPFHTPVFVVTHEHRDPWERPGGTTFYFVNDGVDAALSQARQAAGDRDIRISGGAATIVQFLNAGLIDELIVSLAPVVFGGGTALFEGVEPDAFDLEISEVLASQLTTHLTYRVRRAAGVH
jgi:dihydrofolate reductase